MFKKSLIHKLNCSQAYLHEPANSHFANCFNPKGPKHCFPVCYFIHGPIMNVCVTIHKCSIIYFAKYTYK